MTNDTRKPPTEARATSGDAAENCGPFAQLTRREVFSGINAGLVALGTAALLGQKSFAQPASGGANLSLGPRKVRSIENLWIRMSDGVQIAARLWLPEDADQDPVPGILQYIPYRKRDGTRLQDESFFTFYASHGYAGVRADIRGSGDSEGLPMDEYLQQEQDDGVEIIAWIAKQPWCTGKVGMFGISWSGFNSLQVAARRPPALKAIITHCSTDDRYADDAHYTGGCINECMFVWGDYWMAGTPQPPDPQIVGPRWREMWRARLEALEFYVGNWMSHPHRDIFWKHASINENFSAIQCAVYAVGGWADPYSSTVARMLANLKCPRKGLMGPWQHTYPNHPDPGPAIDWMDESLRWWDHWLKGIDTGIMTEPMYRVWMQEETTFHNAQAVPGRWVAEDSWPSPRIRMKHFYLNDSGMEDHARPQTVRELAPLQTVGITAPMWYMPNPVDYPGDQRIDDARSLTFDSSPIDARIEVLGAAVAELELSVDKPVAFLMLRLNEVTHDGISRRVTYGVLNLCHRESHETPTPLEPGKRYRIHLQLRDTAHVFKPGSRIRLSVSTTSWPMIWPSPEAVHLKLYTGTSTFELPVRTPRAQDLQLHAFAPAFIPENSGMTMLVGGPQQRSSGGSGAATYEWDPHTATLTIREERPYVRSRFNATGTEIFASWRQVSEIRDDDPTSARLERSHMLGFYRTDWDVRVEITLRMTLTQDTFLLTGDVQTFDEGKLFFSRKWERPIARQLV